MKAEEAAQIEDAITRIEGVRSGLDWSKGARGNPRWAWKDLTVAASKMQRLIEVRTDEGD